MTKNNNKNSNLFKVLQEKYNQKYCTREDRTVDHICAENEQLKQLISHIIDSGYMPDLGNQIEEIEVEERKGAQISDFAQKYMQKVKEAREQSTNSFYKSISETEATNSII